MTKDNETVEKIANVLIRPNSKDETCDVCNYSKEEHYKLKDGLFCPMFEKKIGYYKTKFKPKTSKGCGKRFVGGDICGVEGCFCSTQCSKGGGK